ncbi:hypothetical protein QCA50_001295 [Cerrena zonata]|uniref:BOD1/SHG1 domain-containing protein n=1 Tax=Cerrena zonata TaxID=2478898 RepID=A0AAW0GV07_9APHY
MRISEPNELVEEFKKSGEFDRLRRQMLLQFQSGNSLHPLLGEIETIVKRQFLSEQSLHYMSEAVASRELMGEVARSTIIERAVADVTTLRDPEFTSCLNKEISDLLLENRHPGTSTKAITTGSAARYLDKTLPRNDSQTEEVVEDHEMRSKRRQLPHDDQPDSEEPNPNHPGAESTVQQEEGSQPGSNEEQHASEMQTADSIPIISSPRHSPIPSEVPPSVLEATETLQDVPRVEEEPTETNE